MIEQLLRVMLDKFIEEKGVDYAVKYLGSVMLNIVANAQVSELAITYAMGETIKIDLTPHPETSTN